VIVKYVHTVVSLIEYLNSKILKNTTVLFLDAVQFGRRQRIVHLIIIYVMLR